MAIVEVRKSPVYVIWESEIVLAPASPANRKYPKMMLKVTFSGFLDALDIQDVFTSTTNIIFFPQYFLFMQTDFFFIYFWL